jgi:tetratricopeptide (TPR) repeat protein
VLLARALLQTDQIPAAYAHLQLVLHTLRPDDADARWWLGQLLERTGRSDEAYDQYEQLLAKHPRDVRTLIQLSNLSVLYGRMTVAEAFLRRATQADPRSGPAAAQLAEILFRLGRADEAAAEARRALQLEPGLRRANYWLGRSLLVLDARAHGAEAEKALRAVVASGVDTASAHYYLAKLLRQQGRTADAAHELELNTRENPLHKDSFYDLALCERELGHGPAADAAMKRFKALQALDEVSSQLEYRVWADPKDVTARLKLARFYLEHQRPDLARPQVEAVLRLDATNAEARRLNAQIQAHPEPPLQ